MERLDDVFTSIGDTLRDPALKRGAGTAFETLAEAVGSSLSELGDEVQRRARRSGYKGRPETPKTGEDDQAPRSDDPRK